MKLKKTLVIAACILATLVGCAKKPLTPAAPWTDVVNDKLYFLTTTTDPSGLKIEYLFDWGDGQTARTTRRYESGETAYIEHSFVDPAWCEVRVQASNEKGKSSAWSPPLRFRKSHPPVINDDTISGPVRWAINRWYRASVRVTDPDGDSVSVKFIWDNDPGAIWSQSVPSGSVITDSFIWTTGGQHSVGLVARDKGNMVARPESTKTVSVSKMAVVWTTLDQEIAYVATPTLGSLDGEPVLYCEATGGVDCYTLDGRVRWSAHLAIEPSGYAPSLSPDGQRLYLTCGDSGLFCLDARSGRRIWSRVLPDPADCTPAIGPDNAIYVVPCYWVRELCRVRDCGDSGVVQWSIPLGDGCCIDNGAVVGRNGVVYADGFDAGSNTTFLIAADSAGTVLWKDTARIVTGDIPIIDGQDRVLVGDQNGYMYCFKPDGSLAWNTPTGELCPNSSAVGWDDEVILTGEFGITCLDASGNKRWSSGISAYGGNTPCVAEDSTIVAYYDFGRVCALGDDGGVLWDFNIYDSLGLDRRLPRTCEGPYGCPSPVIGPDGDLYIVDPDCGLMCISHGGLRMAHTGWPTYNHDNAHSGWAGRQ